MRCIRQSVSPFRPVRRCRAGESKKGATDFLYLLTKNLCMWNLVSYNDRVCCCFILFEWLLLLLLLPEPIILVAKLRYKTDRPIYWWCDSRAINRQTDCQNQIIILIGYLYVFLVCLCVCDIRVFSFGCHRIVIELILLVCCFCRNCYFNGKKNRWCIIAV